MTEMENPHKTVVDYLLEKDYSVQGFGDRVIWVMVGQFQDDISNDDPKLGPYEIEVASSCMENSRHQMRVKLTRGLKCKEDN